LIRRSFDKRAGLLGLGNKIAYFGYPARTFLLFLPDTRPLPKVAGHESCEHEMRFGLDDIFRNKAIYYVGCR
jgi:hypothetical protein